MKWPLIVQGTVASLPAFEGVVAALLTAMSLLAILGLRHPIRFLPVLVFESAWKLIWLAVVAIPNIAAGELSDAKTSLLFNVSLRRHHPARDAFGLRLEALRHRPRGPLALTARMAGLWLMFKGFNRSARFVAAVAGASSPERRDSDRRPPSLRRRPHDRPPRAEGPDLTAGGGADLLNRSVRRRGEWLAVRHLAAPRLPRSHR